MGYSQNFIARSLPDSPTDVLAKTLGNIGTDGPRRPFCLVMEQKPVMKQKSRGDAVLATDQGHEMRLLPRGEGVLEHEAPKPLALEGRVDEKTGQEGQRGLCPKAVKKGKVGARGISREEDVFRVRGEGIGPENLPMVYKDEKATLLEGEGDASRIDSSEPFLGQGGLDPSQEGIEAFFLFTSRFLDFKH